MGTRRRVSCVSDARQTAHKRQRLTQPLVVRLVQPLVADGVVLPAVDPVDAVVREEQEAVWSYGSISENMVI